MAKITPEQAINQLIGDENTVIDVDAIAELIGDMDNALQRLERGGK